MRKTTTSVIGPVFVGLDYHTESVQVCVLDHGGQMLFDLACWNDVRATRDAVSRFGTDVRASIEACADAWEVTPLNEHEAQVAERLFGQLRGGGYVLADGNYDATALFDRAGACGYQLVAAQWDNNPGAGHHYQSPYRLR
jgi:hypothetical protein